MALDHADYTREWLRVYEDGDLDTALVAIHRRELVESLKRHDHTHILEVGCALEPMYPYIEDFETYTIVEPSVEMARSVAAAAAADGRVDVLNSTMEDAAGDLAKRRFDFIICSGVLHAVSDPAAFLSAIRAICDACTVCHVIVPNANSFHRLLAVEMGLIERVEELSPRDRRFGYCEPFHRGTLRALLHECGFRVTRDGTFFLKPFTHDQMREMLDRGIVPKSIVEGLYRMSNYCPELGCELFAEAVRREIEA